MTLDPSMIGHLVHHRGVEIIVTTCAFPYGRARCHTKKEAAIVATPTVRAIGTTMATIDDRMSDGDEHHVKAIAMTSAKPHAISRLPGASRSLDTA